MKYKKVSVIITTYRRTEFIKECVESVLKQTYSNIEIVLVDDNGRGTDEQIKTYNMIKEYLKEDNFKYIVHDVNKNGSAARNTGIKNSTGDYIAFLDDDDIYIKNKIEKQVEVLNKSGVEVGGCSTGFERFFQDGKVIRIIPNNEKDITMQILNRKESYCFGSTLVIKRDILEKVGLFDESYMRQQDLEYVIRICEHYKIEIIPLVLSKIRIHENLKRMSAEKIENANLSLLTGFRDRINKLSKKDQREIYFNNYLVIAKQYGKERNIAKVLKYLFISGKPIRFIYEFIKDAIKYISQ